MSVTNLGEKNSAYAYVIIVNSLNIYCTYDLKKFALTTRHSDGRRPRGLTEKRYTADL